MQSLGFDIMLDDNFNGPRNLECVSICTRVAGVLLEVNSNPGCADRFRVPLVRDLIETVYEPLFPPTNGKSSASERPPGQRNKFTLIHDFGVDAAKSAATGSAPR